MADIFNPDIMGGFRTGMDFMVRRRGMQRQQEQDALAREREEWRREMDVRDMTLKLSQDQRDKMRFDMAAEQVARENIYREELQKARQARLSRLANARPEDVRAAELEAFQDTIHLLPNVGGMQQADGQMMAQDQSLRRVQETSDARVEAAEIRARAAAEAAQATADRAEADRLSRERIADKKNASEEARIVLRDLLGGGKAGGQAPISRTEFISRNLRALTSRGYDPNEAAEQLRRIFDEEGGSAGGGEGAQPRGDSRPADKYAAAEQALAELEAMGEKDFNVFLDPKTKEIVVRPDEVGFTGDSSGISSEAARERIKKLRRAGGGSDAPPASSKPGRRLKVTGDGKIEAVR